MSYEEDLENQKDFGLWNIQTVPMCFFYLGKSDDSYQRSYFFISLAFETYIKHAKVADLAISLFGYGFLNRPPKNHMRDAITQYLHERTHPFEESEIESLKLLVRAIKGLRSNF